MKHLYIAVYSVIIPPDVSPKFHSTEEILADSDEQALITAENIALTLDAIENNRLGTGAKLPTTRAILLVSIRDQVTRQTIYSIGYTVEE